MAALTEDKGVMLGVTLGAAAGVLVILTAVLVVVLRRCTKKNDRHLSEGSHVTSPTATSYSAPNTRSSSPQAVKRGSMGSMFGDKTSLQRSVTMDMIPDFSLPSAERVQPDSPEEAPAFNSMLQFQYNLLDHLQPDRYSMSSLEDENEDLSPRMAGQVVFSMLYDGAKEILTVTVLKARNLMGRGRTNSPRDPFVKLFLLPDEKCSQQSRVAKKTLAPSFNETFVFPVPMATVDTRTLRLSVYDVDQRRVRHSLGHAFAPLAEIDLTKNETLIRDLEETSKTDAGLGEIGFSLTYNPTAEKLKVVILKATGLHQADFDKDERTYVRVQLLHGQSVQKARKSTMQAACKDPAFNESFSFTIPCRQLDSCSIHVTLMMSKHGVLTSHDREYGRVAVGSYLYARGAQNAHWQEMVSTARTPTTRWHTIQPPTSYTQRPGSSNQ